MSWALLSLYLLAFSCGVFLGRWFERYRLLDRLLRSSDPENWTAAHRVQSPKRPSKDEDDSDFYPPTPTRLKVIDPLKETVKQPKPS